MLYVVTNRNLAGAEFLPRLEKIAEKQPDFIQLREKDLTPRQLYVLAREVKAITDHYKVKLIVNGSVEVALAVGSFGVHIGYQGLPASIARSLLHQDQWMGVSVHTLEEAVQAERDGANYIIAGHIFTTDCKAGLPPRGLDFLRCLRRAVSIPVIAIGGIDLSNARTVIDAGADGIAVMSSLMRDSNPGGLVKEYYEVIKQN